MQQTIIFFLGFIGLISFSSVNAQNGRISATAVSSTSDVLPGGGTFTASGPSTGSCSPLNVVIPVSCTIGSLATGSYIVSYTPPNGWVTEDSPKSVSVTSGSQSEVTIKVHRIPKGSINCIAVSSTSDVLPGGGTFTATGPSFGSCSPPNVVIPVSCIIGSLTPGSYNVIYSPPDGWVADDSPKPATVTSGSQSEVTIRVHKIPKGSINCTAVSSTSDVLNGGGSFTATGPSLGSCSPPEVVNPVSCIIGSLTPGSYNVIYSPPDGWVAEDSPKPATVASGSQSAVTIKVHKIQKGSINCTATSATSDVLPGGGVFTAIGPSSGSCSPQNVAGSGSCIIDGLITGFYSVSYSPPDGWVTENNPQQVTVTSGQQSAVSFSVRKNNTGEIFVTITPQDAIIAGAKWQADGEEWRNSGTSKITSTGNHTISFKEITGWRKPEDQVVIVYGNMTTQVTGAYKPYSQLSIVCDLHPVELKQGGTAFFNLTVLANNSFIEGATITVIDPFKTNSQTVYSDINGKSNYTLSIPYNTQIGTYYLSFKAEKAGYVSSDEIKLEIKVIKADDVNVKIIGIMQNTHNNPPPQPIGLKIAVKLISFASYRKVELEYYREGDWIHSKRDFVSVGFDYYRLDVIDKDGSIPGSKEKLNDNDKVFWRINIYDQNNNIIKIFATTLINNEPWTLTQVFSYEHLKQNFLIEPGTNNFVSVESKLDEDKIEVKNNKAIYFKINYPAALTIDGDYIFRLKKLLSPRSFPFDLLNPPSIEIKNLSLLPNNQDFIIEIRRHGDLDVAAFSLLDILLTLIASDASKASELIKASADFIIPAIKDIIASAYLDGEFSLDSGIRMLINNIAENKDFWQNIFIKINSVAIGEEIIKFCVNLNMIGAIADLALFDYDFIFPLDPNNNFWPVSADILKIKKTSGVFVDVTNPEFNKEIKSGSNKVFQFEVHNVNNADLYNVWFNMEIKKPNNDGTYTTIATTYTPDNLTGQINFNIAQGINIYGNNAVTILSSPFQFDKEIFSSDKKQYEIFFNVFTNGYPNQSAPFQPLNLSVQTKVIPFYIVDDLPPSKPVLNIENQTGDAVKLNWQVNENDVNDLKEIKVYSNDNLLLQHQILNYAKSGFAALIYKLPQQQNIKIKAIDAGGNESEFSNIINISASSIALPKPAISPQAGTFPPKILATITCAEEGAIIRFTLDGTDPTTTSQQYTGAISINSPEYISNVTIKAKAWKDSFTPSEITQVTYSYIPPNQVAKPIITPNSGNFPPLLSAEIKCATEGAIIRYTSDGTTPTTTSRQYTGAIPINSPEYISNVTIKAKAWKDQLISSEVAIANYTYIPNNVTTQTISIAKKWNLISLNIIPDATDIKSIIQPLINSGALIKMQDESGNAIENILDSWINNIGNWSPAKGYYLRANNSADLSINGTPIALPFNIQVGNKWSIISYPLNIEQNALMCVQPLIDANALIKIQDEDGNALENILGTWINNIGNFKPGKAYYLRANQDKLLTFSLLLNSLLKEQNASQNPSKHYSQIWNKYSYCSMNIYFFLADINLIELPRAEIAVYDGLNLISNMQIHDCSNFNSSTFISLIAAMDDPTTKEIDGFIPGHKMSFRIKDKLGDRELSAEIIDQGLSNKKLEFEPMGTIVVKLTQKTLHEDGLLKDLVLFNNYPNPFNPSTRISFSLPDDDYIKLSVYDVSGREIRTLYQGNLKKGIHSFNWDSKNNSGNQTPSGIYFYQLKSNDIILTKKLLLLK